VPSSKIIKGDAHLQLSILRELSTATTEKADVNTILQMVLEGLHRGIGLERAAIALVQGRKIKAKYALGEATEHWRSQFLFDVGPYSESIFTHAMESDSPLWFNEESMKSRPQLYPDEVVRIVGRMPCLVSVLQVDHRKVGVFYADRWTFGGKITDDQFESFKHFASQAQLSLAMMKKR